MTPDQEKQSRNDFLNLSEAIRRLAIDIYSHDLLLNDRGEFNHPVIETAFKFYQHGLLKAQDEIDQRDIKIESLEESIGVFNRKESAVAEVQNLNKVDLLKKEIQKRDELLNKAKTIIKLTSDKEADWLGVDVMTEQWLKDYEEMKK